MRHRERRTTGHIGAIVLALLIGAVGCSSTPETTSAVKPEPEAVAAEIVNHLKAGKTTSAEQAFAAVASSQRHRDVIYARVYHGAGNDYAHSKYDAAGVSLRFLANHYPEAIAVREALLYSLFLQRVAQEAPPSPAATREMQALLNDLRSRERQPPAGVDLVSAQLAVDAGRIGEARDSLAAFRSRWNGSPAVLLPYVTEIERYVASH